MATNIYTQKDNGDLQLRAEIEEDMDEAEAVKLLLEESPRLRADEFIVMVGDMEDGTVSTVRQQETVTVDWTSSRNGATVATEDEEEDEAEEDEEEEEEERPKPKNGRRRRASSSNDDKPAKRRPGRPRGSKNRPKAGAASGGSKRRSGFKRNPASDE